MKILIIGNFTSGWDGSICDEEHIAQALEALGCEVDRHQREDYDVFAFEGNWDFVLIAQWDNYDGMLLEAIRKLSCPLVYWAFDYQAEGQEWHERLVATADLYLSKRIADSKHPNWQWLSQDFSPKFLDRYPGDVLQDIDVLFTGTYLPWATERNQTLKAVDDQFDLHIYSVNPAEWISAGFKNVNGPMMDDALPRLIARAKINLSIDHTIERGYWSDRNAQIMACGGFVLFRYVPLSEAVFRDNVAYFHSIHSTDGCLEQIRFYLDRSVRHSIAANGYDYAQDYLKVDNRVRDLLTIVKGIL